MKKLLYIAICCFYLTSCSSMQQSVDLKEAFDIYYNSQYKKQAEKDLKVYFSRELINTIRTQYLPIKINSYSDDILLWEESEVVPYEIQSLRENYLIVIIGDYRYRYTFTINNNKITNITKTWLNEGGN